MEARPSVCMLVGDIISATKSLYKSYKALGNFAKFVSLEAVLQLRRGKWISVLNLHIPRTVWVEFDIEHFQVTRLSNMSCVNVSAANFIFFLPSHLKFCPIFIFYIRDIFHVVLLTCCNVSEKRCWERHALQFPKQSCFSEKWTQWKPYFNEGPNVYLLSFISIFDSV